MSFTTKEAVTAQSWPGTPPEEHFAAVRVDTQAEADSLIALFDEVVIEQHWDAGTQVRTDVGCSTFFSVTVDSQVVGGIQLVPGFRTATLPCLSVWPELNLAGRSDVADIALLALHKDYRARGDLFWPLCVEMWRYCVEAGITELWAEVPSRNLRLYQRMGWPLRIAGPLRPHWGEDCYPCTMTVVEAADAILERAAEGGERYQSLLKQAFREPFPTTFVQMLREHGKL